LWNEKARQREPAGLYFAINQTASGRRGISARHDDDRLKLTYRCHRLCDLIDGVGTERP
jgi:hypothetical protein